MPTYIGRKKNPFFPIKAISIGSIAKTPTGVTITGGLDT
jgi:hypothetical protein